MNTQSLSVTATAQDGRCRYWAKVVRADQALPLPSEIDGADTVPGKYIKGDEELFAGDVLIEGEENHHRKQRGWTYTVTYMSKDGGRCSYSPDAETKAGLKAAGIDKSLLAGAGGIAACVRVAHAVRQGLI